MACGWHTRCPTCTAKYACWVSALEKPANCSGVSSFQPGTTTRINLCSTSPGAVPGKEVLQDMPGPTELLIILGIALLLFGGSRLAGLGKGVGRSIREFKTEVKSVDGSDPEVVDAEIVQPETRTETEQERRIREIEARERDLNAREAAARDEATRQHDIGTGI